MITNQQWVAAIICAAPEMHEALAPFVALLQKHNDKGSDDRPVFGINDAVITIGDLRRAARALAHGAEAGPCPHNLQQRIARLRRGIATFEARIAELPETPVTSQEKRVRTIAQRCLQARKRDLFLLLTEWSLK